MFKFQTPMSVSLHQRILLLSAIATLITVSTSPKASGQEHTQKNVQRVARESNVVSIDAQEAELNNLAKLAQQAHQHVNEYRASLNLAPLEFNALIGEQARIHSQNMAQKAVKFSHDGFETRIIILENNIDYSRAAENVAYNMGYSDPVAEALSGWIKSEGHRNNMEGDFDLTGIGVAKNRAGEYYFTQIFILENSIDNIN